MEILIADFVKFTFAIAKFLCLRFIIHVLFFVFFICFFGYGKNYKKINTKLIMILIKIYNF